MAIEPIRILGNRFQVGEILGELAKPVLRAHLETSALWAALQAWRGSAELDEIGLQIRLHLPHLWQELEGMAWALDMPVTDLLLWNCRGDLLPRLAPLPETLAETASSASIALNTGHTRWLAQQRHEELPSHLVDLRFVPEAAAPGCVGLSQPGTLPGCGIWANHIGIAQVTDQLWPSGQFNIDPGLPRIPQAFLARAILDCSSMDQALHLLGSTSCLGGLHFLLCSSQDHLLWSVETAPGVASYEELGRWYAHSNHFRHTDTSTRPQQIPPTSIARYQAISGKITDDDPQTSLPTTLAHLPQNQHTSTALFEIQPGKLKLHLHAATTESLAQVVEI